MRARTVPTARRLAILLSCPVLVGFCVAFVDRPAASLAHADFAARRSLFDALTHIVDPIPPLAGLGLAAAALAALFGWRPGPRVRVFLACCLAVVLAIVLKDQLKYAFGRLWPETWVDGNPSFIRDGAYGFFPFHGGRGWASFPSGHTTLVAAPASVLWRRLRGWRPLVALPVALVVVGLFGADYHFAGDMVAGLYLGAACGAGALALVGRPDPQPRETACPGA